MKIPHLDQFIMIAQEQNITKASKILRISQPGLTKNIKNLEFILDIKLFNRHRKGLSLTDEGKLLYDYACFMQAEEAKVLDEIKQVNKLQATVINIGAGHVWGIVYLPYLFKELYKENKNIKVKVNIGHSDDLYKDLQHGKYDFILSAQPEDIKIDENFKYIKVKDSFFQVFASEKHPLREEKNITIDTLKKYKFVSKKGFYDSYDSRQLHNIYKDNIVFETPSMLSAINTAYVNNLLIVLPATLEEYARRSNLMPISDSLSFEKFTTGVIYRKNNININIIKSIINFAKDNNEFSDEEK